MRCLLLYYSFTGQARRAAEVAARVAAENGWTPTLCAIEFADPADAPRRPFTIATSKYWTQAAQRGRIFAVRTEPREAVTARYDFVLLFSNTWGDSPAVPVRSFLQSDAARAVLRDTPFGIAIVCRRLWKKNAEAARGLGEAAGGHFIDRTVLTHFGGQIGSLVQTVTYLLRGDGGRQRLLGFPLPRYGLSDDSLAAFPPIVKAMLDRVSQPSHLIRS